MTENASAPIAADAAAPAGVRPLRSALEIAARVRELGAEVTDRYRGERPLFVGVLKGACMFQCDLARAVALDVQLDFVTLASYGADGRPHGRVRLLNDLKADVSGRHVLVVEGVVDSGRSLSFLLDLLKARGPASLAVATLLDKRPCREVDVPLDYVGWTVGTDFLVGYGLDSGERFRNLPFVGTIEERTKA